jgi:hypothetical protein
VDPFGKSASPIGPRTSADTAGGVVSRHRTFGVPECWDDLWGRPSAEIPDLEWRRLKKATRVLAGQIELCNETATFRDLVGASDLARTPVHRWFSYKEGYSPGLLPAVLDRLGVHDGALRVVDPFGGVATTALAGLLDTRVAETRSVEYSPLAHFVGQVKLSWPHLDAARLLRLVPRALSYPATGAVDVPGLAAFSNPEIFHASRLAAILRARDHVRSLAGATWRERDFFLLGVAAVVEDLSGAMKDGRALRIVRDRRRRPSSLAGTPSVVAVRGAVKRALAGQWTGMIHDLQQLSMQRPVALATGAVHARGDARALQQVEFDNDKRLLPPGWADVACFSPPYLNFIDYTEVHKLELWLLGFVTGQAEFKATRLGTLRSHPSVKFPDRHYFAGVDSDVVSLVHAASDWVTANGARREVGPIIQQYFEDMFQVWREQYRVLKPGGAAACVVANSTFSRRTVGAESVAELWRLPILTDVLLAHLALGAGFNTVQLWFARELRPRNTRSGRARESVVVAWKR